MSNASKIAAGVAATLLMLPVLIAAAAGRAITAALGWRRERRNVLHSRWCSRKRRRRIRA